MTVGEVFAAIFKALTDFLIHFLEVFFFQINWLDANIFMVVIVLLFYMGILSWVWTLWERIVDFISWILKYLGDAEYRTQIREDRKAAREAADNLYKIEKAEIEAKKAELGAFGRFLYFWERNSWLAWNVSLLIIIIILGLL